MYGSGQQVEPHILWRLNMPALKDFIPRLGSKAESICSTCCQIIRPTDNAPTLQQAQAGHRCGEFSLNTVIR